MRVRLTAMLGAAAIGLCAISLQAASAGVRVQQNVTFFTDYTQADYYADYYVDYYRPACPDRYSYACWYGPYGYRHCGCRHNLGYYLFRFY